ncbi:hypothetical protein MesoLjLc_49950 [Mesorhizobium sp. L-8-10]|uniref:hypothetical protein n=1 Tax=unclassified Mesorhizobium TaxID=325217 RepID=UPI00192916B0|nr:MULTISPECIES: hypothetical protein [unclassified Mesorhizobium]BCH25220.1 hypothetical protein MesoLjLb_50050 [Mesorhizobium sp. L-8-3]BCH33065.1 hypothetical protein MesoLjLc_49950 [Mesorhizobium sp. L-8-10]
MTLPVLIAIVVVGIALVVVAVHLTGGSRVATIGGDDHARQLFQQDFPDELPGHVAITTDRMSAFLALSGGRTGIVQSFGDGYFTRMTAPKDVAAVTLRPPATVSIRFRDFTWTGGHFTFAQESEARAVAAALDAAGQRESQEA